MTQNNNRLYCAICLFVAFFFTEVLTAMAQNNEKDTIPEFDCQAIFDKLNENNKTYIAINDSLYGSMLAKDEWVNTYLRRARKTYELGQENQLLIDSLKSIIKKKAPFTIDLSLHDDFIKEEIVQITYDRLKASPEKSLSYVEAFMETARNLAELKMITSMSGDQDAFVQSYQICKDIITNYVPGRDVPISSGTVEQYLQCYNLVLGHKEFIVKGGASIEEYNQLRDQLVGYFNEGVFEGYLIDKTHRLALTIISQFEMSMLRNVYIPDTTHRYDNIRDILMKKNVEYYDSNPNMEQKLDISNKRRLVVMRHKLGRISDIEAIKASEALCKEISKNISSETVLSAKFNNILECVYFVDISDLSFEDKRLYIKKYCDEILSDLANFHYDNKMPNITRTLSNVAVYGRIHKYLNTPESKNFLETLLFYSQPFTLAHSETVTLLAQTILGAVIKKQPSLLTGMLGYETARQVKKDPKRLKKFFTDAARYHDLGKTRMPDIIRNEYRQLTDHEFSIIRKHPEFGLDYLKIDSSLMEFHDIVIGHHKWYNNKGGYPASFDKANSQYSILIDILTLADCLEAATSRLGRNYRKNKHYEDVLKEFQAEAGTRYNPDLVKILESDPKLGKKLNYICEKGWEDIYYRVFQIK